MFVYFDGTLFFPEITPFQFRKQPFNFVRLITLYIESTTMNAAVTPLNIQHLNENLLFHRFPETVSSCGNLILSRRNAI